MTDYLNNSNKTTLLFKQFQNKSQAAIDTGSGGTSFFNERYKSLNNIYNTDIFIENIERNLSDEYKLSSLDACGNIPGSKWNTTIYDQDYADSSFSIPNTNLIFYKEIYLNPVSGTNNAWWLIPPDFSNQITTDNNLLKDMIPFNFNSLSLSTFSPIFKYWDGEREQWKTQDKQNNASSLNWLIDYASGILQFYQTDSKLNSLNIDCNSNDEKKRPRISFIKYAGLKGLENFSGGSGDLNDITTLQGNVTTLQGDVTTLQEDVATLQGDGDIKGDNLFLGNEGTTPKIDLFFKNGVASHDIYKYRIEIGKSDDFINSPVFPPNDAYGMNVQANSDGLFVGIETYDSGSNWRPLLKWGDDSTDTPFTIHSKAGNHKWEFRTDGTFSAQSFAPTYSSIPNLAGKIGQVVDASNVPVTLVVNNFIQVRSLTIPYTGVWLISMALLLSLAFFLPGDITYSVHIQVNGGHVQSFIGTNLTGVNGTIPLYLSVNDVVSFNAYLSGSGSTGMNEGQRAVWGTGYTFLKAIRIA